MTKTELVHAIAVEAGITKSDAKKVLNVLIEAWTETLKKGDKVTLQGFGSFSLAERSPRAGRNPQTGQEITIAGRYVVRFKPSNLLVSNGTGDGGPRSLSRE